MTAENYIKKHGWYETPEGTWRHPDMGEDRFTLDAAEGLMRNIIKLGMKTVKEANE